MYTVSLYAVADPSRIREVYPEHRAWVDEFGAGGGIVSIGIFGDPIGEGAMAIFRSREAAEAFVARDPFVLQGVVTPSALREWTPLEFDASGARIDA